MGRGRLLRLAGLMFLGAAVLAAADANLLELRGRILDGARRARMFRVTLFSIETAYSQYTLSDPAGEFHFRKLSPGNYTLSIFRRGLGEVHRTVVVTGGLADKKGVVRTTLRFSTEEAAASGTGALVSRNQLAIPSKARNKYDEATRCLAKHDAEGAQRAFEDAVQIAPRYSEAWNALGVLAYQMAHYDEAEQNFRKAVEAEPGAFDAQVNLGGVLLNLNRPQEALAYNQAAAKSHPKDSLPNAQLGMNYLALDRADEAEEYLRTAERIDPANFTQTQWFLAGIYSRRGDRGAAVRELQDLLARHPDGIGAERARRALARIQRRGETIERSGEPPERSGQPSESETAPQDQPDVAAQSPADHR